MTMNSMRCTLAFACGMSVIAGCRAPSGSMSLAMVGLTGESSVRELAPAGPFGLFPLFLQHQAISIQGLLPMPDVGQELHMVDRGAPTSGTGIAVLQSYKLIGEPTDIPAPADVALVARRMGELQAKSLAVAQTNVAIGRARSELARLSEDGTGAGATDAYRVLVGSVDTELRELLTTRRVLEGEIETAECDLRDLLSRPGIVVASWTADAKSGVTFGGPADAASSARDAQHGFVVLGGIRTVSLIFGEDFWWLLDNLREHEREYVEYFGVTSYLLQAKHVAYVSGLDTESVVRLRASLREADAQGLDALRFDASLESIGRYANSGNVGAHEWKREPFCFVCGLDLPDMAEVQDQVLQQSFGVAGAWPAKKDDENTWHTVLALVNSPGRGLTCKWPPWGEHLWEKYRRARDMDGAPTCRICQGTIAHVPGAAARHGGHEP